jgi:hypothetical protein
MQENLIPKLPQNFMYGNKNISGVARQYNSHIQSDQKSIFSFGETSVINIPTRANNFIDTSNSYLSFTVNIKNGSSTNIIFNDSCGAHAYIDRLVIRHGSNILEDTQDYALVSKLITDWHYSADFKTSANWVAGTRSSEYICTGGSTDVSGNVTGQSITKLNYGSNSPSLSNGAVYSKNFAVNLFSLVGSLAGENYLPLDQLQNAPLRLEITWKSSPQFCVGCLGLLSTTNSDHSISEVEFISSIIEVDDATMDFIRLQNPNGLHISSVQYKMVQTDTKTIGTGATNFSVTIPARYKSVKTLVTTLRDSSILGDAEYFSNSLNKFNVSSYQYRVGNLSYPQLAPTKNTEIYLEMMKAMNGGINDQFSPTYLNEDQFTQNLPLNIQTTTSSGGFAMGLDLESYSGISNRPSMYSGTDLTSTDCLINVSTSAGLAAAVDCRVNVVAIIDVLYTFKEGVGVVSY